MARDLVVSTNPRETRVALLEDGVVSELFLEREAHRGIVGSIYKGRVTRVLPGMQSAFVDLGLERDAFLHAADVFEELPENLLTAEETGALAQRPDRGQAPRGPGGGGPGPQGAHGHQGGADHLARLAARPLHRPHAHGGARRGLAEDHRRGRAATPQDDPQGVPTGARGRGADRPDRGARARGRGLPAGREVPLAHVGRGARPRRPPARPGAPLSRALAPRAAAARPALGRRRRDPPRQRARLPAHARARARPRAGARPPGPPARRPGRHHGGARRLRGARAGAAVEGLAARRRLHRHQPDRGPGRDRRQHRPLRGQEPARGNAPQGEPRRGARDRAADPAPRPRRHHRGRLHRHGGEEEPARRDAARSSRRCARTARRRSSSR